MKLRKELGLLEVFCISSGAMISSGLFILPALAYSKSGPAVILAYLLASLLIIPAILSKAELIDFDKEWVEADTTEDLRSLILKAWKENCLEDEE